MFDNVNMFIWYSNGKFIQDEHGQIILEEKPALSFDYEFIKYYRNEKVYMEMGVAVEIPLSDAQQQEIETFIANKRKEVGILGLCVDVDGNYLGRKNIDDADVHAVVSMAPPNGDDWIWNYKTNSWVRQYFYTTDNVYTRKDDPTAIGFTLEPKPEHPYFEYALDTQTKTWNKISTPEAISKYKKESLQNLLSLYIQLLQEEIDNAPAIVSALKALSTETTPKRVIVESSISDISNYSKLTDIEEAYELTKMIMVTGEAKV